MKTYLKISIITGLLLTFYGAYIMASGNPDYLPFFKLALSTFTFCVLLKVYIDFRKSRDKKIIN